MPKGSKLLLLGNEAIARGALEAGVGFASAYPGTPSSEIIESLMRVSKEYEIYVEWSVNEKVAFEAAYAASISNVRSLTAMKHVGLNVASDPLMTSAYTGVEAGFVVVTADDPNMHSSQNEQDNRWFGLHAYIPVFEPSNPQEAKDLTAYLYVFSEKFKHPTILRSVTRVSHTHGIVTYNNLGKSKIKGVFIKKPEKWVAIPQYSRLMKANLVDKWEKIYNHIGEVPFNKLFNKGEKVVIVASGIGYVYVVDAVDELNVRNKVTIVKIASSVPLPKKLLLDTLSYANTVFVVEEGDPVVEFQLKNILLEEKLDVEVYGKNLLPKQGELSLETVVSSLAKVLNVNIGNYTTAPTSLSIPSRPPTLCPGCPYRSLYYALKLTVAKMKLNVVYSGDIGCYTLGVYEPFKVHDTVTDMGSSIGLANGFAHVLKNQIVVAIIGDSTFYHAGIPALLNAVYNNAPMLVLILDNETTAMTGFQPHPGSGVSASSWSSQACKIPLENVAKGVGVKHVFIVDPYDIKLSRKVLEKAFNMVVEKHEPVVIIARRPCVLYKPLEAEVKYVVIEEKCIKCKLCYDYFSCPAIVKLENGIAKINQELCINCGACIEVCPTNAIVPISRKKRSKNER